MNIEYRAYDRSGREVAASIDAAGTAEAAESLRKQGLFVIEMIERGVQAAAEAERVTGEAMPARSAGGFGRTARLKNVSAFFRQLSVLVATGTPMVDALESIERQCAAGKWRDTVSDIRQRVEEGATFAEAMEPHPAYFDAVCRSLVSAGESSGTLDDMLRRLTMLTRQQLKIRSSIAGAMVYPILLLGVCLGVLGVMIGFVLPRFEGLFETLGAPLPPTTRLLMSISAELREYWWGSLMALGASGFGVHKWFTSDSGRRWWHRAVLRLPMFGPVVRSFSTSRVTRVLGVLLEGRVPMLDALKLTRQSTGNVCFAAMVQRAEDEVMRGGNISNVLATTPFISQSVTEAVRSGEKTGQVGPVLANLSEFLDEDNEVVLRSLTSLIEPVILIALGLIVGFVAVSMFLPLFDLATTSQTGGGGS